MTPVPLGRLEGSRYFSTQIFCKCSTIPVGLAGPANLRRWSGPFRFDGGCCGYSGGLQAEGTPIAPTVFAQDAVISFGVPQMAPVKVAPCRFAPSKLVPLLGER